jgi:hypothetical protein
MNDIFAIAARKKFRFNTSQGLLSVEDLWDLPLQTTRPNRASLDNIAISLNRELKESETTSFVDDRPTANDDAKTMFDIVLQVIEVRKEENKASETLRVNAEKKQRILEIIANKEDEALAGKSVDELRELVGSF